MFPLQLAMLVPGFFRLGRVHVPVFGLFAAAGLVMALWLSQRTARLAGLSPERLWDAGMFAIVAAFVASRVLLITMDLHAFLTYPILVMSLPSLTYGGMLLTALLTLGYLRWKRLPLLDVLDAWAPCGALLAAVLSVGHFVEGTAAGMPTRLPWGVVTPGDTVLGRVHPVQMYAAGAELALCVVLFRLLALRRTGEPHGVGRVAGMGLAVGGLLSFVLGMLRQPVESYGNAWLDPQQWIALAGIVVGAGLWVFAPMREWTYGCGGVIGLDQQTAGAAAQNSIREEIV